MDDQALSKLRRLSRPITMLVNFALALLVIFQAFAIVSTLFFFHAGDSRQAIIGFADSGLTLEIFNAGDPIRGLSLATLGTSQRAIVALLSAGYAACYALALFHLSRLFTLYSQGKVFAEANVAHMKRFGLWLAISAIAVNLSGRLFFAVTGHAPQHYANAIMAIVYGTMIWAIAHAMELGRLADAERNEFV